MVMLDSRTVQADELGRIETSRTPTGMQAVIVVGDITLNGRVGRDGIARINVHHKGKPVHAAEVSPHTLPGVRRGRPRTKTTEGKGGEVAASPVPPVTRRGRPGRAGSAAVAST